MSVGKKALLFEKLDGKKVRCTACSHYCVIPEGKTGICAVRKNISGSLHLLVYGRPCAVHVDPIEKKPLFHFLPGSEIFSLGTVGCNFACDFCQNWDISQASKEGNVFGQDMSPQQIVQYCKEGKIPSIAFTYNEPAIFFEYAYDTMELAKENGIKTVFVSNGYMSGESIEKLKGKLDAINIDLKSFNADFYKKVCKARLEPVLGNIKAVHEAGVWLEVTTLLVPGENDSAEELKKMAEFIASIDKSIPWHVTAFHPDYKMMDKERTSAKKLFEAHGIGKGAGLKFVYTGNIHDSGKQSTYCPDCKALLVKRAGNSAELLEMKGGKCKCGSAVEGVWE